MTPEEYKRMADAYWRMNAEQRQQAAQQFWNDPKFQQFAKDYTREQFWDSQFSDSSQNQAQTNNAQPEQNYTQNQSTQYGQNWGNQVQYTQSQEQQSPQTQQQGQFQAQTQTQHQFWYGTTEDYRKKRDSQYAEELYNSNPNGFDYNSVFKYVKGQAPQVTEGEIRSTVQNINRQYNQFARLGAMNSLTPEQIRQGLLNGEYSQSDLEQLRIRNPQKYNEFMGYDDKATATENAAYNANAMYNLTTGKGVKQEQSTEEKFLQVVQKFFGNINYNSKELVESYKRELNSPEVQKYKTKMLDAQREMQEIDDDLESLREDLTKQYPWISKSQLNSILQDRSYKLLKRKNELHKDYTRAKGEVEFWINMAGKNFEADLKGVELQRAEFQDKFSALGFAKSTLEFETPEQKRQAELDQIKKKAQLESELNDINSKDPQIQRTALMKALEPYYRDFGSIILRPQAQAVEDIIAQAKRERISVWEAFRKNFTEQLYNKPQYKAIMNNKLWIKPGQKLMNIWGKPYIQTTNEDWTVTINQYGGNDSSTSTTTTAQAPNYTPASTEAVQKGLEQVNSKIDGSKWGQCWYFVNNYLQNLGVGRVFSDPIQAKKAAVNSSTPTVGSVAVIDRSHNPNASEAQKKYGHVGIVTAVNGDWSVVVKQSNKNWDEKVFTSTYKANQIFWYFDPTKWGNSNLTSSDIISYNDKTLNRKLSTQDKNRIGNEINRIMSDPNADIDSILEYSAGGKSLTDSSTQPLMKYQEALNGIGTLSGLLKEANTGPIVWILRSNNPYDQKAREIQTVINQLVPTLARWVYWEVWVLTDSDIKHYSKTVPNLQSTEWTNNAILALTLNMLAQGYKNKLRTLASAGNDVSRFGGVYKQIMSEVESLRGKAENTPTKAEKYWWKTNVIKTSLGTFTDDFTY